MIPFRKYIPEKKNLFIFGSYPDVFEIEDTYLIVGSNRLIHQIQISEVENVFSIYTFPVWLKHLLKINQINIFYIDQTGEIKNYTLSRKFGEVRNPEDLNLAFKLLSKKASTIDRLFKTDEATNLFHFSLKHGSPLQIINQDIDYIPKAHLMDAIKLNYKITNVRAREITQTIMNLIDNVVPLSFYSKFINYGLNPDNGFLNNRFPSLTRDLTEIQRISFKKKIIHLFNSHFFESKDLSRKHFPLTTIKVLKQLSSYFFYGNRFKRMKDIYYYMEAYKRGKLHEIFGCL